MAKTALAARAAYKTLPKVHVAIKTKSTARKRMPMRRPIGKHAIKNSTIRNFCNKAGKGRIGKDVFPYMRERIGKLAEGLFEKAVLYSQSTGRKTLKPDDIRQALRCMGVTKYGFE